jgi:hypothetical protein
MDLIAAIEDPSVARRILEHLGLAARPPPRGNPWRRQGQLALPDNDGYYVDPPALDE